jgi:biotin transport system substrate-specific component
MATARRYTPYAETVLPADGAVWSALRDLLLMVGGSFLIALGAQVAVRLPFTPVPVTGQTFAVLLVGFALGARRGAASILLYLLEGGLGLPFFAGAKSGWAAFSGPTGGYLVGFVFAAALTGFLAERGWDRSFHTTLLGMLLGSTVIFAGGVPWLAQFVGWKAVWMQGLLPFLPGDGLKALLAAALLPTAWRMTGRDT